MPNLPPPLSAADACNVLVNDELEMQIWMTVYLSRLNFLAIQPAADPLGCALDASRFAGHALQVMQQAVVMAGEPVSGEFLDGE